MRAACFAVLRCLRAVERIWLRREIAGNRSDRWGRRRQRRGPAIWWGLIAAPPAQPARHCTPCESLRHSPLAQIQTSGYITLPPGPMQLFSLRHFNIVHDPATYDRHHNYDQITTTTCSSRRLPSSLLPPLLLLHPFPPTARDLGPSTRPAQRAPMPTACPSTASPVTAPLSFCKSPHLQIPLLPSL